MSGVCQSEEGRMGVIFQEYGKVIESVSTSNMIQVKLLPLVKTPGCVRS